MASSNSLSSHAPVGIPCSLYRGGTSRGLLLRGRDLPHSRDVVGQALLRIFGSPGGRQIDGVGGGSSLTSKAMLVDESDGPDHDIRMTFAQVAVDAPTVDWGGNCGNMTAAVGAFAIECGMVPAVEPITVVRIRSTNTGLLVAAHVPVRHGAVQTEGDFAIPGVAGTSARIDLEWFEPAGSVTGRLLPTGRAIDRLRLADGTSMDVSIVDAGNPVVFCPADALGLHGTELPADFEARPAVMARLEEVRSLVAEMLGIVASRTVATSISPGLPKVGVVAPASEYRMSDGATREAAGHDLQARLMTMQTPHRSMPVSGAICTAAAATIAGTVVQACLRSPFVPTRPFRIAHPCGVMDVSLDVETADGATTIRSARVGRTARLIMSGLAYVPASTLVPTGRQPERPAGSCRALTETT